MSDFPHARLRVAVYGPDGRLRGLVTGTAATVAANTPPGGRAEPVPSHVRRVEQVRSSSKAAS